MPTISHPEKHFAASEVVRDIVIGMADGLTVPFALAAGLSGAFSSKVIITAGLAEIAAGAIAMGLGGYLAAKTDSEHYHSERRRELREIWDIPHEEQREVAEILYGYGLNEEQVAPLIAAISQDPQRWADFMMRFELGLAAPDDGRAVSSALTIALAYVMGGLVPLTPYFFIRSATDALHLSALVTLLTLFGFGYIKGRFTGVKPLKSGWQTALIGGLAATAAFLLANLFK